jgi:branched-chain amino acid aminotransferase
VTRDPEKKDRRVVWIDGRLDDEASATVPYDDHGITVGDGAFETIKLVDGTPFALSRHLARLDRSLDALRLPHPRPGELTKAIDAVSSAHDGVGFLRVTVTGGRGPLGSPRGDVAPRLIVAVRPGQLMEEPTDVEVVPWTRNERGALAGVKSTSYAENVVALAHARERGATEALFGNNAGNLCEGTGSNVFIVIDDELTTPPLSSGCLAGVNRELLMEVLGDVVERDVPMADLELATEIFLTSTAREVQPVRAIGGKPLPNCPGPHTVRARAAWLGAFGPGQPLDP